MGLKRQSTMTTINSGHMHELQRAGVFVAASSRSELSEEDRAATLVQTRFRVRKARSRVRERRAVAQAEAKKAKPDTRNKEIFDLFIEPNTGLELSVRYDSPKSGMAGVYSVTGPSRVVKLLWHALHGVKSDERAGGAALAEGVISPKNECSLPAAVRVDAGIPEHATHFAYIYPLRQFKRRAGAINLADESWCYALLLGGFAYFGSDSTLLAVNALTIVPSPAVLPLVGPYAGSYRAALAMERLGRIKHVAVDGLADAKLVRCGWVHPAERPGGHRPSTERENPHGAILYESDDGKPLMYALAGGPPANADEYDRDGVLSRAHGVLRQALVDAVDERAAIAAARRARWVLMREVAVLAIALAAYFGFSCAFLMLFEDTQFTAIESIYFAAVTASTVGYALPHLSRSRARPVSSLGRLACSPHFLAPRPARSYGDLSVGEDPRARAFALVMIITGVFIVGIKLSLMVSLLTKPFEQWAVRQLDKCFPPKKSLGAPGSAKLPPMLSFYTKRLLPTFALNVLIQFGSAAIFTQIENWDYFTALYHCLVTATTVGYGDVDIITSGGQLWATVHILLSVSMLGDLVSDVEVLRNERARSLKRVTALNQQVRDHPTSNPRAFAILLLPACITHPLDRCISLLSSAAHSEDARAGRAARRGSPS